MLKYCEILELWGGGFNVNRGLVRGEFGRLIRFCQGLQRFPSIHFLKIIETTGKIAIGQCGCSIKELSTLIYQINMNSETINNRT